VSFEGGQALPDVDGGPQLAVDTVGPHVESTDPRDKLHPQGVDLRGEPCVDTVDLLVESNKPLVQDADVPPKGMNLRTDDVLECLPDLVGGDTTLSE
jgi:hypothetical protein